MTAFRSVKSALNGTTLANASEDQKKSAATIGDLKDAVNNISGDVNWTIQDVVRAFLCTSHGHLIYG